MVVVETSLSMTPLRYPLTLKGCATPFLTTDFQARAYRLPCLLAWATSIEVYSGVAPASGLAGALVDIFPSLTITHLPPLFPLSFVSPPVVPPSVSSLLPSYLLLPVASRTPSRARLSRWSARRGGRCGAPHRRKRRHPRPPPLHPRLLSLSPPLLPLPLRPHLSRTCW